MPYPRAESALETCTTYNSQDVLSVNTFPGINIYAEEYFETQAAPTKTLALPQTSFDYSVISFSTPFVYRPPRRAKEGLDDGKQVWDGANGDFGYVPQALIDWMAQNPDYAAQYPGLASCLPGGPRIDPDHQDCRVAPAAVIARPAPDVTLSSVVTVDGEGCFNPAGCPTSQPMGGSSRLKAVPASAPASNTAQPKQTEGPVSNSQISISLSSEKPGESVARASTEGQSGKPGLLFSHLDGQTTTGSSSPGSPSSPSVNQNANSGNSNPDYSPQDIASLIMNGFGSGPPSPLGPSPLIAGDKTATSDDPPTTTTPARIYVEVEGTTLAPGSPPIIVKGTTYYLPVTPTALFFNGSPSPLALNTFQTSRAADDLGYSPILIAGTTLTPGGPPITVAGPTYSIPSQPTVEFINNSPFSLPTEVLDDSIAIGGTILTPGGPAVTIAETTYSLSSSPTAIYVNNSPSPLPPTGSAGLANAPVVIAGITLTTGAPAVTISGISYSLPNNPTAMIVNGTPSPLQTPLTKPSTAPIVVGGRTLAPGGPAVTVSGTTYSLPVNPTAVIVNGTPSPLPVVTIGTPVAIGDVTLTPGASPITVSGTTYSLPSTPNPTAIFVNGSPSPLPQQPAEPQPQSDLVVGSQTLLPGSAVTVSGVEISLPTLSGTEGINDVVVGGKTQSFIQPTGSGGAVAFTVGSNTVTANLESFTASAVRPAGSGVENGNDTTGFEGGGGVNNTGGYTGPDFTSAGTRSLRKPDIWGMTMVAGMIGLEGLVVF
ncbi:MAG: hypothetical protein Q9201_004188 [Fulgogasparrea decipioides]